MNKWVSSFLLHSPITKAVLFFILFTLSSCFNQKKIVLNNGKCILDFKNAGTLITNLKNNEFKFQHLKARMSVDAIIDSSSNSFNLSLRMKKDSIIWMSLSKLGIEGARVLITKDSVWFVNPIKKQYFNGDFHYLSTLLSTDLDFEAIQSLLVGNSVTFYDEDEKLKPGVDNCQYTLGTTRKHKLRKAIEKGKALKESAEIIYMASESFKITRILFYDFNPDRSFDAQFDSFGIPEKSNNQLFPYKRSYTIKANKFVQISLDLNNIVLNEELSFPFKVNENYERIW